jgi:4-hydroxy-3-methylbut-2-enyl diphosphate reductase
MRLKVAGSAGFCWGVQRSLRLLEGVEKDGKRTTTLGPLVYNGPVLASLQDRGIANVERPDQVSVGDRVVLRPHGATDADRAALSQRGAEILDATCPHILESRRMIRQAAAEGQNIVLAGNRDHDEVRFLLEGLPTRSWVVSSGEEARALPAEPPVALACQSTLGHAHLEDIEEGLRERFPDLRMLSTRCGATDERQDEALSLAAEADVLVVVGPYHSGNARRLAELGRESGKQTFHVETPEDVPVASLVEQARLSRRQALMERFAEDPERLRAAMDDTAAMDAEVVIGVTAGASTPPWALRAVVDHLLASTRAELIQGLPKDLVPSPGA